MNTKIILTLISVMVTTLSFGQDTTRYRLRLKVPVADFSQNISLPYYYPSMGQAFEYSNDFYEAGFWGIDELGDVIFMSENKPSKTWKTYGNHAFKYILGLAFSRYASELPIPLGVWAHEEYHRSVLGIRDISSKNGNWMFTRWDGTVFGITDSTLSEMKSHDLNNLLYSYVAGVQYEIMSNQQTTLNDFYHYRTLNKNALLLYNAWYVWDYFRFADGPDSDSVKVLAPPDESSDPAERDYAGNDLTAWIYDMFSPDEPYTDRDPFPGGNGVNRRIGNSDLSPEGRDYLHVQRNLSLLNFLNPAIFFFNRFRINDQFSFNLFTQYAPTHYGHDIAVFLPVKYKRFDLLLNVHTYSNYSKTGIGRWFWIVQPQIHRKVRIRFHPQSVESANHFFRGGYGLWRIGRNHPEVLLPQEFYCLCIIAWKDAGMGDGCAVPEGKYFPAAGA